MKTIKCRICKKDKEVEDDYPYKTCVICRVKEKSSRRLKKASRELLKGLKIDKEKDKMPSMYWSFSAFKDAWQWETKPTFDDYKREVIEWKRNKISDLTDKKIARRIMNLKQRKDYARRFLRFDLYPSTFSREKCTHYRYMRMGIYERDATFQKEHSDLCSECHTYWDYNFDNNMLNAIDNNEPYVNPNAKPLWKTLSEDCSNFRLMISGEKPRDTIFCANHHLSCKDCLEWYARNKKNRVRGFNLF